jgi:hypothetical protein
VIDELVERFSAKPDDGRRTRANNGRKPKA